MSSRPRKQFSDDFLEKALVERAAIAARLEDSQRRVDALLRELAVAESQLNSDRVALTELEELLGVAPQLPLLVDEAGLGGRALREAAVQVLLDENIRGPIHYTDWFERLSQAGYRVRGKNPVATFLTQISRDDRVEPIGSKSGLYKVSAAAR